MSVQSLGKMTVEKFKEFVGSRVSVDKQFTPMPKAPEVITNQPPPPMSTEPLRRSVIKPTKRMAQGTNYDPYDPKQTRANPDGRGSAGVPITGRMVAVGRYENGMPHYPMGTVLYVPKFNTTFLVADVKNKRYNDKLYLDFATPHRGGKIDPKYQGDIEFYVVQEGSGPKDAKARAESFK